MMLKRFILTLFLLFAWCVHAVEFKGLQQHVIGNEIQLTPQFEIKVSEKVRHAIESGIVITFVMQVKLNQSVDWWFDTTVEGKIQTIQVRYFSLSSKYQLHNRNQKSELSFVDLDQLLEHLGNKTTFVLNASNQGDYVLSRFFLDKQALPSIMQLPNVFDPDWNLNSDWQSTDLLINSKLAKQP